MQYTGSATTNQLHQEAAMNFVDHPTLDSLHAAGRHHDLRVEAERDRQFAQARAPHRVVTTFRGAVRWAVGVQVIRAGERIRGASSALAGSHA